MYVIQVKIHLFALYGLFRLICDTYMQNIVKRPYKRNMRVIFVSIIPYSQYILIYNIDKPIKIGDTRKRVISI